MHVFTPIAHLYAVAKLKDPETSRRYELELSNRFTVLQEDLSIEEKWEHFSTTVKASGETVVGCRSGTNRECWISDRTWNLIDDRKEAKKRKDQAYTKAKAQAEAVNYRKLDTDCHRGEEKLQAGQKGLDRV